MSYTVTLLDYPGLTELARHQAQSRYRQALENALGGPGGVVLAWRAWQHAEHALGALSEEEWRPARRWILAAEKARAAGMAELPNRPNAAFEVRPAQLERQSAP